jgi:predicted nucleic acid-binding protein
VEFVDTNVLLYAISRDAGERRRAERANEILESRDVAISVQVLQEFYVEATRATRPIPLTHRQAFELVETFLGFPVQELTTRIVLAALTLRERFGISDWDAAILEAARVLGCDVVLSEELADGQDYDGVRVENPFRGLD